MRETTAISDWKDGFLFLGNQLALDFLNTRPILNGKETELLPDFSSLLRWFKAAELLSVHDVSRLQLRWKQSSRAPRTVKAILKFREQLRKEVLSWERGNPVHIATVARLNRLLAAHPMLTRLKLERRSPVAKLWFDVSNVEDLFAPLAHSVASLFAEANRNRVRKCVNCVEHFLDISKKGTRRWCSMQLCGNRAKVAAYAARHRRT